ncbi:DUF655 domain-containing protein [Candidatus Micrarchaeota archaeon]|nr:DUF655 domain-containing protein [Candidatus Micrarchaeota archaeon]
MNGMEEYGVVLDYLPYGKATDTKREPIAQLVGGAYFTLLEVVPRAQTTFNIGEKIYVGKGVRDKVDHIKGRISYYELTSASKSELKNALKLIVKERESHFISFINKCGAVTIRLHQLELLPGIGKKHMLDILNEREKKPFENFEDLTKRIALLPDPINMVTSRIEEELKGSSKYYILTRAPYLKQ